jgi:tetratricopeptide (TPR) repeat protein
VAARIGRVHARRGTPKEGLVRLQPLLADLDALPTSEGAAALQVALAHLYYKTGRYVEQLAAAKRGARLARALGHDWLLADAECRRGTAYLMLERVEEGLAALEGVTRLADAAGDLDSLVRALNNLSELHLDWGDWAASTAYNDRALAVAERMQDPVFIANQTYRRAEIAVYAGAWDRARCDFEQAEAISRQINSNWILSYALAGIGRLDLFEGACLEARPLLEQAIAMADASGDLQVLRYACGTLAQCDLLQGDPSAACARLVRLLDRPGLAEGSVATHILPPLALAYLKLGDVANADQILARLIARARTKRSNLELMEALWIRAMADSRAGADEQAERALNEGLTLTQRMPYPYAEARYRYEYGALYTRGGDYAAAQEQLVQARTIFKQLGAHRDVERVRYALASQPARQELAPRRESEPH